jgi:TonB family protein
VIEVTINGRGLATQLTLVQSAGCDRLDAAALEAAAACRYTPARRGDVGVESRERLEFHFRLRG